MLVAIIPALDEEGSIAAVIERLLGEGVSSVIVADNGSQDETATVARAAGARVVFAPRRGYGSACLAGLGAIPPGATAIVFCDADGADDLARLYDVTGPILRNEADLVVGSRALGKPERGALTPPQRVGNMVAVCLMRILFWQRVTDLGPFRCVSTAALARMRMQDPTFGWTAEMQTKAMRLQMRYREVAVDAKVRTAGESKISGRMGAVVMAGWGIITTILRHRFGRMPEPS